MNNRDERLLEDCLILSNEEVAPGQYRMRLQAPQMARLAAAGQFCMIQTAPGLYPFLRRPMCFERIQAQGFQVLYKVEGEGTAFLARTVAGQVISVQGPLGNGFPVDTAFGRHIIVAGGVGVAPFPALADALLDAGAAPPTVILAARTRHLVLCGEEFRALGCEVQVATDDGSAGVQAYASQMLERLEPGPGTRVYACGPMMMMQTTAAVALAGGASCLVSLEAQMACGDGACLGCVVEARQEQEAEKMVRVCCDGPVFEANMIDWEAHNHAYDV